MEEEVDVKPISFQHGKAIIVYGSHDFGICSHAGRERLEAGIS